MDGRDLIRPAPAVAIGGDGTPLVFPTAPSIGDTFLGIFGEVYEWDGVKWTLREIEEGGGRAQIGIGPTPPEEPGESHLWWDTVGAQLYIWTGAQWVVVVNQGVTGVVVGTSAPAAAAPGSFWWDTAGAQLYLYTGAQWVIVTNQGGLTGGGGGGSGGGISSITAGSGLQGGTITTFGTIALSTPVSLANGGTGVSASSTSDLLTALGLGGYLPLTGGTLSGVLNITTTTEQDGALNINIPGGNSLKLTTTNPGATTAIILNRPTGVTNGYRNIRGQTNWLDRWVLHLGDSGAESSTSTGTNFQLTRYNNAGSPIDSPIYIPRDTGVVSLATPLPVVSGGTNSTTPNVAPQWTTTLFGTNYTGAPLAIFNVYTPNEIYPAMTTSSTTTWRTVNSWGGELEFVAVGVDPNWGTNLIGGYIEFVSSRGTLASPSAVQNGDNLGSIRWDGAVSNTTVGRSGHIGVWAIQNFTSANRGTQMMFAVTPTGAATVTDVMQLTGNSPYAFKLAGGSWGTLSDRRAKRDIVDYVHGLAEVLRLRPITYCLNGKFGTHDDGHRHVSLIEDEVKDVMPEMTGRMRAMNEDVGMLDLSALPMAFINAIKELTKRLEKLEARLG
jgi:hypothetical protein